MAERARNVLVVLNYNDADTTLSFIKMAVQTDAVDKIIVVDNCSQDDSFNRLVGEANDKVDVIRSSRNGGYAFGNNLGCRYAISRYEPDIIFISNPDVRFDNEVIRQMQEHLIQNKTVGVIAPIVNQGYNAWNRPGFWGLLESIFLIMFNLHKKQLKRRLLASREDLVEVGVVEGSFFGIRTEAYTAIGGLDERTFLYCEENILACRLAAAGYSEAVLTKYRYDHFHSVSIRKCYGSKTRTFKKFHPSMHVYLKHYLKGNIIKRAVFEVAFGLGYVERFLYDFIKALRP